MLLACSHGEISSKPKIVEGIKVYTYQGRVNYQHERDYAEKKIKDFCGELDQKKAVIISQETRPRKFSFSLGNTDGYSPERYYQVIKFKCD